MEQESNIEKSREEFIYQSKLLTKEIESLRLAKRRKVSMVTRMSNMYKYIFK